MKENENKTKNNIFNNKFSRKKFFEINDKEINVFLKKLENKFNDVFNENINKIKNNETFNAVSEKIRKYLFKRV